ncbi:hypothetical protein GOBAR_DD18413 [Gossypium barbadense]|nr:hypothetical protein GOBAR_DD18413 [Gossypium barbadense]
MELDDNSMEGSNMASDDLDLEGATKFMPPREEFPTKGLEGAPSNDIGVIRESMMNVLKESNTKKIDKKRRKDEFLSQLIEEEDEHEGFIDEVFAIRQATRESIQSQHEWHRREEFRRSTGGWDNIYEEGRSSHGSAREHNRERTSKSIASESEFTLRRAIPELVRSKSSKQPKVNDSFLKSFRRKIAEVGQGVKLPTPYEVSDVYLESEYQRVPIQQNCRYFTEYEKIIDNRWNFMHSDLHSAGYFLNPQFQFGVEHSENVLIETLEGTRSIIERLEPTLDTQVRMVNQLLLFRDKHETFGTPQAQRAWKQMNPKLVVYGIMSERISFGMWGMDKMSSSSMTIGYKGATLLWNNLLWCNKDEMDRFWEDQEPSSNMVIRAIQRMLK